MTVEGGQGPDRDSDPGESPPEILVFNPGSSSLKFGVYAMPASGGGRIARTGVRRLASGVIQPIGGRGAEAPTVRIERPGREAFVSPTLAGTPVEAASRVVLHLDELGSGDVGRIRAVGCRVVHGGPSLTAPVIVTPEVLSTLRRVEPLAPLHNPIDVAVLQAVARSLPGIPAVAVFDTAFHATLPEVARTYALPFEISERHGLRRYGFHGISHAYVSGQLLERLGERARGETSRAEGTRLVTCHLGSGASLCALRDGVSVDTSMGMTPLEGLVMGTRAGDIDAGLVLFLIRTEGLSADHVHELLNSKSGLLGLSGVSADLRTIERAAAEGDRRAELALAVFAYRVRKYLGAYAAALGGLDAVAFTGGIGEHSASMRARICQGLGFLGLELDAAQNAAAVGDREAVISTAGSPVEVWVIPTDEELEIAAATADALKLERATASARMGP